jgi:hypothetical protein
MGTTSQRTAPEDAFTTEERAAMKERAAEVRRQRTGADPATEVLARIAELPDEERALAERVHAVVTEAAPDLVARLWYGMPAYARPGRRGAIVCFLQPASKFGTRYATLGFNDVVRLDDGAMWPTAYALTEVSGEVEDRLRALVARAVTEG